VPTYSKKAKKTKGMGAILKTILFFLLTVFMGCRTIPAYIEREYVLPEIIEEVLIFNTNRSYISKMELIIEGYTSGPVQFIYRHQPFDDNNRKSEKEIILAGNFRKTIGTDWYEPECLIKLLPENSNIYGNILIRYRVY
jgi:hypothetical protein